MDAHGWTHQVRHVPSRQIPCCLAPKSSTENERSSIVVESKRGDVLFRQVAGAVARRIKYYVKPGDIVKSGQEVGFIKFGSRIDVYLPLDSEIHVSLNDKVKGRETLLATLKDNS